MRAYISKSIVHPFTAYLNQRRKQRLQQAMRKRLSRLVSYGLS